MFMLDTNICIYILNERPAYLRQTFNEHMGQMVISIITLAELHFGVEQSQAPKRKQNREQVHQLCAHLEVLNFDESAAEMYGVIRSELKKAGTIIGNNDLLIAAHAKSQGMTVVTNNMAEFKRVKGLKVANWIR